MNFSLSDEQAMLVELAEQVARDLPAALPRDEYPFEVTKAFAAVGLTGIDLPAEDGGQGGTLLDSVLAIEAVARTRPRAADMLQATNFGAIRQIAAFGTPDQKERYLRPALSGEKLATVAMTEPDAGSAATELRARARREGGSVVVNGTKIFNSDGPFATHFVVWVRFGEGARGVGSVIVPADAAGFVRGQTERFLSAEAHCSLLFEDCRVPEDHVLVPEDAFRRVMPIFNIERLGNAARALGYGERAFRLAVDYAKARRQFGRPLADFQGLRWRFADMKLQLEGARMLLYRAAATAGRAAPSALDSALAKWACNETGYRVADAALQIFGGYGFSSESELGYLVARTRGWMIAGGSVEILRNRIADEVLGRQPPAKAAPS